MRSLLPLLALLAACKTRACPPGLKTDPNDCAPFVERSATQPRFCTGSRPGEGDRPCWITVVRCGWRCR